jgi:hypothetical protein
MSEAVKVTVPPDLVERCKNYAEEMVTRHRNSEP